MPNQTSMEGRATRIRRRLKRISKFILRKHLQFLAMAIIVASFLVFLPAEGIEKKLEDVLRNNFILSQGVVMLEVEPGDVDEQAVDDWRTFWRDKFESLTDADSLGMVIDEKLLDDVPAAEWLDLADEYSFAVVVAGQRDAFDPESPFYLTGRWGFGDMESAGRVEIFEQSDDTCIPSVTLQWWQQILDNRGRGETDRQCDDTTITLKSRFQYDRWYEYSSPEFDFETISLVDLLADDGAEDTLQDKVLFMTTPEHLSQMKVAAYSLNYLVFASFHRYIAIGITVIAGIALGVLLLGIYGIVPRWIHPMYVFIILVAANFLLGWYLQDTYDLSWPFVQVNLIILVTLGMKLTVRYQQVWNERQLLQRAFDQYVNPDLLKKIQENPRQLNLQGEERLMTILFSDIRGFTNMSEKLAPQDLIHLLNDYLKSMTDVVWQMDGTIDKYMGDAIMTFWNAPLNDPDHAIKAVRAALAMDQRLVALAKADPRFDGFAIGIGISTGKVVVGSVGSEKRLDYTALGDKVNLASRLEQLTKYYQVPIIISERTYHKVKDKPDNIAYRLLDRVTVKGKGEVISIYQPLVKSESSLPLIQQYQKAFDLYQQKKLRSALEVFQTIKFDPAAKSMVARIRAMQVSSLKDWDGVWHWENK